MEDNTNTSKVTSIANGFDKAKGQPNSSSSSPFVLQQNIAPGAITQQALSLGGNQKGDIYYGLDGIRFFRLAIGTTGQVLTVSGGVPIWTAATVSSVNSGLYDNGTQGGTYNIDWTKGDRQKVLISSAITLTYSGALAGQTLTLNLDENGTGGYSVTLPASTKWPNGTIGTFVTTANALNTIVAQYDGTNYRTQLAPGFA